MAKSKKAAKPVIAGVVDTSTEIKRTNMLYLSINQIGHCNEKGKSVFSLGYSGKMIAKPDAPMMGIIARLMEEMLPMMDYSTPEAAAADLKRFKEYVDSLQLKE